VTQAVFERKQPTTAFIALGANTTIATQSLQEALNEALRRLDRPDCRLQRTSRLFHTPCFPVGAGSDCVNAVAVYETTLAPRDLLSRMHEIETAMGRERVQRWASRTMDLDLLTYGDAVLPDPATFCLWRDLAVDQRVLRAPDVLITPHPRLHERAFVLIPMADIAPEWRHPVSGLSVTQMVDALPEADRRAVRPTVS